ncbi:hypothetical protein E3U43_008710 [Larimichthys crocea]|uniref:Uncharacterized protein n=1 Tax=Larimichthys crocea TaxID=215358 RepID=A0ACD3RX81_LARCR|nr:hypothetical protein E3U43_008710 [Larimichthys crocea]
MNDLQLPRCLSPLEPFASATKHGPVLNNSTNHGNKNQPQPCLHGRLWLTVNPGSLQFPIGVITHRENKSESLPQGTNHSSWSGTISADVKPDIETTLMKESSKQSDTIVDAAAPKRRKRKRTSHFQDAAGCLICKNGNVSDGTKSQISMSVCSVSLSSNNVLAKERDMFASSSDMPYKLLGKPDEPSTVTESQREKTTLDVSTDQTRIRTRGFLKKTQETPCNACIEHSLVVTPPACRAKTEEEVPTQKRKRGRPRKTKLEEAPFAISEKKSHSVEGEQEADSSLPKEVKRYNKRRRNRSEVEVIPIKRTVRAEAHDSTDIIPAEIRPETPKQPKMVILEKFEKLIKRQHSKTRKSKESQDKETNEPERDVETAHGGRCEDLIQETEIDIDVTQPRDKDGTEESPHVIFSVTVDKNHNRIFNNSTAEYSESQQDDTNSSTSDKFGDGCHPVSAAEREQTLQSPDEAQQSCDARVSDTTQQTAVHDEGRCHSNSHTPPQEDKVPLDNSNPQMPERTGSPLPDTGAATKSSGCNQQEDDDDEDVDILLYSPDKEPQPGECENSLDDMDINLEEEEDEEDVNEIDVTGDEAE